MTCTGGILAYMLRSCHSLASRYISPFRRNVVYGGEPYLPLMVVENLKWK